MSNTVDVQATRAAFMLKREAKLEAERNVDERDELQTTAANPPAVRATDGGRPGTKERNPLEVAAEINAKNEAESDADNEPDEDQDDAIPTSASKVEDIKAYLDAQGIAYDGVTRKADLLALVPAAE